MNRTTKIRITNLNPHVICVLCGGYYINATTITECLHSFCRTCITRYLETSKYCPVCDVMVHKTRPLDYIRSDKTLQDLVYKLVPGLYKSEMKRRREYYADVDPPGISPPPSEDRGDEFHDRIIYTEDEKISLSLELCAEGIPFKTPSNVHGHTGPENIRIKDVRYLQCPAAFSIANIKKFIRMKFDIKQKFEIDIFHTAEPLPDYYSLMDIAYIYTWTRRAPLRLYYTVFERKPQPKTSESVVAIKYNNMKNKNNLHKRVLKEKVTAKVKAYSKKRKLLDGPDDISPDLAFDKARPNKRKTVGTPMKRARRMNDKVDELVIEAMSESEEQLAKLSLDCSADARGLASSIASDNTDNVSEATTECGDAHIIADEEIVNTSDKCESMRNTVGETTEALEILTDIAASKLGSESNVAIENECVLQNTDDKMSNGCSKQSSAQVSPGSGSIKLSLFEPLNGPVDDHIASSPASDVEKHTKESSDKLYDFHVEETSPVPIKKKRKTTKDIKAKEQSDKIPKIKKKAKATIESKENDIVTNDIQTKTQTPLKAVKTVKKKKDTDISITKKKGQTKDETGSDYDKSKAAIKTKPSERVKRKYVRKQKVNTPNNASVTQEKTELKSKTDHVQENDTSEETNNVVIPQNSVVADEENKSSKDTQECAIDKTHVSQICTENKDQENQMMVNSSSLQEPVTPLYGETPKVNESNQGLPCSPNMDSLDNGGRLVIDIDTNSDDVNSDKHKHKQNGDNKINDEVETSNRDMKDNGLKNDVSNCPFSKEIFRSSYGPSDMAVSSSNSSWNGSEIPLAHSDPFRHYMNGLSPTNAMNMLGGFSPPLSAHLHMGHMAVSPNGYQIHDASCDQPLDLTNSGSRDEYTKGKIFKTKMVKKTFPKQDSMQNSKDKTQSNMLTF